MRYALNDEGLPGEIRRRECDLQPHPSGDRIFIHTACADPSILLQSADQIRRVPSKPSSTPRSVMSGPGVAPYTDEKFKYNFRHNSFFVGDNSREAVNPWHGDTISPLSI